MSGNADVEKAIKELDKEIQRIKGASQAAFWEAGLKIIGRSMEKVPNVLANLIGSAYVRGKANVSKQGDSDAEGSIPTDSLPVIGVEVGYYAVYALKVHESMMKLKGVARRGDEKQADGRGTYWDNGSPKFLESVVLENLDLIPEIIRKRTEMDKDKNL